jgi:hypothetical protein
MVIATEIDISQVIKISTHEVGTSCLVCHVPSSSLKSKMTEVWADAALKVTYRYLYTPSTNSLPSKSSHTSLVTSRVCANIIHVPTYLVFLRPFIFQ